MAKGVLIGVGLTLAGLVGAAGAAAATPPPPLPPNPAISQYVETVPTSSGPAVPAGQAHAHLSRTLARRIQGSGGQLLLDVASSAAYGAPQTKLHANKHVTAEAKQAAAKKAPAPVSASALGAAGDAVGAGHSIVLWLGLALLATTAVGVGAAVLRARK
jgi:hypothetical protein